jgi:hypothetical protein
LERKYSKIDAKRKQLQEQQDSQLLFTPVINHTYKPSTELVTPVQKSRVAEEPSFKPSINKKSQELA